MTHDRSHAWRPLSAFVEAAAMHRTLMLMVVGVAFGASACGSDDHVANPSPVDEEGVIETGVINTEAGWLFRTEKFTLAPGEEHFVCYAADAPEDLSIQRFSVAGKPMIHHFLMTTADATRNPPDTASAAL